MYDFQSLPFMTATANPDVWHAATSPAAVGLGIDLATILSMLPWIVILIVYLGDKIETVYVVRIIREALQRAQINTAPPRPSTPPAPILPPPPRPILPSSSPPPPPKPQGPFADAPRWFQLALAEIGFHETGNNQGLDRYIALARTGANGDPWCAIFANAMLESAHVRGTRSPSAQSFRTSHDFVQLPGPALGAVVVFWRGSPTSGLGHVGFYRGEDVARVWTLGGNEQNMVQIEALEKSSGSFGLVGYYWPAAIPLPAIAAIIMPSGSPANIGTQPPRPQSSVADGLQANIVATYFSGQESAYGGAIKDSEYGVSLPYRFTGDRPRVRVTNPKTGSSVDCSIIDVGPWNIDDPYWATGDRPQAESGTDKWKGRRTNGAGIDLTLATAQALQIDGKGLVNWEFIK